MSVQNATVLKSYFETNDAPSQSQFGDLIDSLQEARDSATTAAALASSAQAIAGTALSSASSRVLRAGDTLTGNLLFTDNTLDIGASGATRPRTGYFGTSVVSPLFTGALTGHASLDLALTGGTLTGHLLFTDNTYDIGATGATRPRTIYVGTSIDVPLLYVSPAPDTVPFTVNGYSVTAAGSSGVLTMSGQWNTSGTPTAIKLNITDSASNAASLLLDLQIGSGSQFKVTKAGVVTSTGRLNAVGATLTESLLFTDNLYDIGANAATRPRTGYFGTSVVAPTFTGSLTGDASLNLLLTGGTLTGNLIFTDNSYDIGASGATRPRTGYFGTSVVSPAFMLGSSVLNVTYSAYSAGTVYTVTATNALADFGTTDPSITIAAAGTYILSGFVKVDLNAATFASNRLFTARIRRTNNTAADIANSDSTFSTGTPTLVTQTMAIIPIKDVVYTTANTNDVLEIWVDIAVLPDAGTLTVEQASIVATRVS